MTSNAGSVWGPAVGHQTGKTYQQFSTEFFARYGVDLENGATLASLDTGRKVQMYVEWYDALNSLSGNDHVDLWMNMINWTPRLTQTQSGGAPAIIGLVDYFVAGDADIKSKVFYSGGYSATNSHGAGVASLIAASHDGKGIMGIAPNAKIAAYNPFDASGTADWSDVINGIVAVTTKRSLLGLKDNRANVVNLSLGAPGWTLHPEWRNVFKTSAVDSVKDNTVYVIAAGNDGISQTANVEMNGALGSTFIVVGSVDADGVISEFSNRPGTACLTDGGVCKKEDGLDKSNYLMNRFIVAPGELTLISDNAGGVTRESGTSLAAPLVSGAVALIHDRWPWLKDKPRDVAKAILDSAQDLGAPGIDPVYGVGLLDVEASQSPLNFGELKYYLYSGSRKIEEVKVSVILNQGVKAAWEANGYYFSAFEKLDSKERDFLIPLSSRLVGTTKNGEYFQDYVYGRLTDWIAAGGSFTDAGRAQGFSDLKQTALAGDTDGWQVAMSGRFTGGYKGENGYSKLRLRSGITFTAPRDRVSFGFGEGDGALMIGGGNGLALASDFDPYSGGTNPLLGFASGGAHIQTKAKIADGLTVSAGVTQRRLTVEDDRDDALNGVATTVAEQVDGYSASAFNLRLDYAAFDWLDVNASYTRLDESNAMLGVRSLEPTDFAGGTATDGLTLGAEARLGSGFSLFGSGTVSRSTISGNAAFGTDGVVSTSFQAGVAKQSVFAKADSLRFSVAAPLHVESGVLDFRSVAVVDRTTGEKGLVTNRIALGQQSKRRLVVEGLYAAPLLGGAGEVSLFGRGEINGENDDIPSLIVGGQARLPF